MAEGAGQVVVETFQGMPRHAPGSRPSLGQGVTHCGVGDELPVRAGRSPKGSGWNLPHARFPQLVRAIPHSRDQQIQRLFEVATEALHPD